MSKTLLQAFFRIKTLREDHDPTIDLRQIVEEAGELSKELRKWDDTGDFSYQKTAQTEAIDVIIAAASAYVGLAGNPMTFLDALHEKLDRWEEQKRSASLC